jgi:hypothetical protein
MLIICLRKRKCSKTKSINYDEINSIDIILTKLYDGNLILSHLIFYKIKERQYP